MAEARSPSRGTIDLLSLRSKIGKSIVKVVGLENSFQAAGGRFKASGVAAALCEMSEAN